MKEALEYIRGGPDDIAAVRRHRIAAEHGSAGAAARADRLIRSGAEPDGGGVMLPEARLRDIPHHLPVPGPGIISAGRAVILQLPHIHAPQEP